MGEVDRWEKRAREIYRAEWDLSTEKPHPRTLRAMLQLGREMAAEARLEERVSMNEVCAKAADARAEKIARLIETRGFACCATETAAIARSTIAKPEPKTMTEVSMEEAWERQKAKAEAAIRADEREKIAKWCDEKARTIELHTDPEPWKAALLAGYKEVATMIRAIAAPKTREAALEEALRRMKCTCRDDLPGHLDPECNVTIARRALEWKPNTDSK